MPLVDRHLLVRAGSEEPADHAVLALVAVTLGPPAGGLRGGGCAHLLQVGAGGLLGQVAAQVGRDSGLVPGVAQGEDPWLVGQPPQHLVNGDMHRSEQQHPFAPMCELAHHLGDDGGLAGPRRALHVIDMWTADSTIDGHPLIRVEQTIVVRPE
jgi:hypothetical protein